MKKRFIKYFLFAAVLLLLVPTLESQDIVSLMNHDTGW